MIDYSLKGGVVRQVAERLELIANSSTEEEDVNLFGRSSFNRYYYTIFLHVRSVLKKKNSDWGRIAHKNMPDVLRETVLKEIRRRIDAQVKSSLLGLGEASGLRSSANIVIAELADLLVEAYQIRCDADYEPEFMAKRINGVIVLRGKRLSAAASWPKRVDTNLGELQRIWRHLGIVV